jgi:hypothetical protein
VERKSEIEMQWLRQVPRAKVDVQKFNHTTTRIAAHITGFVLFIDVSMLCAYFLVFFLVIPARIMSSSLLKTPPQADLYHSI